MGMTRRTFVCLVQIPAQLSRWLILLPLVGRFAIRIMDGSLIVLLIMVRAVFDLNNEGEIRGSIRLNTISLSL